MQIEKMSLQNIYEITIYDYEEGSLEWLRTYIIIFKDESVIKDELSRLETISCGEDLDIFLKNETYSFEYLINYDPVETDKFLYEELFLQENKEFFSLVLKYNSISDIESLKNTQQTLESDKVHFVPEDEIPF